jgi:hypothetical protein
VDDNLCHAYPYRLFVSCLIHQSPVQKGTAFTACRQALTSGAGSG